jgi:hypothetical protein
MLDQLLNLVKQFGQDSVVKNQDVPNEYNQEVMADATQTIASGFQNVLAGGGLQNILDLFRGGGASGGKGGGLGGLLKNPMVTMMIGYFISKLVSKYKMSPSAASNVANQLIPNTLDSLITRTTSSAPEDDKFDFNDLISSITRGNVPTSQSGSNGFDFQNLLNQFTRGGQSGNGGGFDLQDIISQVTRGAQQSQEQQVKEEGGGIAGLIRGLFN